MSRRLIALSLMLGASLLSTCRTQASSDYSSLEWHMKAIKAEQAWINVPGKGQGVKVAVIDTGGPGKEVAALSGSVIAGMNFADPLHPHKWRDGHSHGTFVSGEIAAHGILTGVAPNASLIEVKVLSDAGDGEPGDIAGGIIWAVSQGASVLNLSLGGQDFDHDSMKQALHLACQRNVAIAVASGNGSLTAPGDSPADFTRNRCLIAVNSMDRNGWISSYSNVLQNPRSITAPGGNIVGLSPTGGVVIDSGTSMAAPLVAGTLALLRAQGYSARAAVQRVLSTAARPPKILKNVNVTSPSHLTGAYGSGILDAGAATAH